MKLSSTMHPISDALKYYLLIVLIKPLFSVFQAAMYHVDQHQTCTAHVDCCERTHSNQISSKLFHRSSHYRNSYQCSQHIYLDNRNFLFNPFHISKCIQWSWKCWLSAACSQKFTKINISILKYISYTTKCSAAKCITIKQKLCKVCMIMWHRSYPQIESYQHEDIHVLPSLYSRTELCRIIAQDAVSMSTVSRSGT